LIALLFNVGGYYIVFWGLRYQADNVLTSRLESNNYTPEEITVLKIPMLLPYPVQEGYQVIKKDKFEHKGDYYKLVKQKLENDTLYIVCIKDFNEKHLVKKMIDFGNLSNDFPQSKTTKNLLSKLMKEYEPLHLIALVEQNGWTVTTSFVQHHTFNLLEIDQSIQSPPPQFIS
jgi:hypothetical protein